MLNFSHPANAGILRYFEARYEKKKIPVSASPEEITQPYMTLGTHPELVERLWDKLTVKLPEKCAWVVYANPCLVHPQTGIIFGFCGGTHTLALRLPDKTRKEALAAGAKRVIVYPRAGKLDLDDIGKEWVFGWWLKGEEEWCLSAYVFAGQVERKVDEC